MKTVLHSFILFLLVFSPVVHSLEIQEYKEKAHFADKESDKKYVLHFYAEWCSVCLAQKRAMQKFEVDPAFKDLKIYLVDFDWQRKLKAEFAVERQSTLILFKGGREIGRSLAVTDPEKLKEFLKKNY